MTSWRPSNPYNTMGPFTMKVLGRDPIDFKPTRIFDNCAIIGNESYACYLLETSGGLILLDCMESRHAQFIENGIKELGYDPADLKYILVTHEHDDHFGSAGYFQEKYGTKVYISEIGANVIKNRKPPEKPNPLMPEGFKFTVDGYLEDGRDFICGDTAIKPVFTPGHSAGCMSFIFPVYDEGRCHYASMWGGSGAPKNVEGTQQLIDSLDKFSKATAKAGVDVSVCSHPFQDNTMERLNLLHVLTDGVPNPFIMGEGYRRYELMYRNQYTEQLEGLKNGTFVDKNADIMRKAAAVGRSVKDN